MITLYNKKTGKIFNLHKSDLAGVVDAPLVLPVGADFFGRYVVVPTNKDLRVDEKEVLKFLIDCNKYHIERKKGIERSIKNNKSELERLLDDKGTVDELTKEVKSLQDREMNLKQFNAFLMKQLEEQFLIIDEYDNLPWFYKLKYKVPRVEVELMSRS